MTIALKRLLSYVRPYFLISMGALLSLIIVTGSNLYIPQLIRQLIDNGIIAKNLNGILLATLGLLGVAVVRGLFSFLHRYGAERISQNVTYDIRNQVYAKLETLSFSYHDRQHTGQLMTRATSDVEGVRGLFAQGFLEAISAILTIVSSAVILFITDWRLALATISVAPIIIFLFVNIVKRIAPRFVEVQRKLAALNTVLQENIVGAYVVKAFAAAALESARYRERNQALYEENLSVVRIFGFGFPIVFFFVNLSTAILIWFGGNLVISGELSLGTLIAFNTYLSFLLLPIFQLGFIAQQMARASASAHRLFEVTDAESEVQERTNARPLGAIKGQVTFEDVSFRYVGTEEDVLPSVSFKVNPGQTVAIVGPTGSGKSTVINLIPRFYDVTGGAVRIDGVDVRDVTLDSLRRQIGVVLQDVNLINGSLSQNIAFGKPDTTQAEIEEAARAAQAHDFILDQPNGYETVIGERGVGLSGGQRQRVAIARALLIDPRILILDDSTSAVDAETESRIQQALASLLQGHTAFVIAQRQSTVRNADLVLVLENGRVHADGKHDQLMEECALYAELSPELLDDVTPQDASQSELER